jgi:hypothetical protein
LIFVEDLVGIGVAEGAVAVTHGASIYKVAGGDKPRLRSSRDCGFINA